MRTGSTLGSDNENDADRQKPANEDKLVKKTNSDNDMHNATETDSLL